MMKAMEKFMADCQTFLEDEFRQGITDELVMLVLAEALRYREAYKVSRNLRTVHGRWTDLSVLETLDYQSAAYLRRCYAHV